MSNLDTNAHDIEIYTTYSDVGRYTTWDGLPWRGFNWWGRRGQGAPLFNRWSSYGVYVDYLDRMHLTAKNIDGIWFSSELDGEITFSYGIFRWIIDSTPFFLDDNLVFALFTYGNDINEHDFEFTTWWGYYTENVWLSNQPRSILSTILKPTEKVICELDWNPVFCRYTIKTLNNVVLAEVIDTDFPLSTIPEGVAMNLWMYGKPSNNARADVIIYDFQYFPYDPFKNPLAVGIFQNSRHSVISILSNNSTIHSKSYTAEIYQYSKTQACYQMIKGVSISQ